MTKLLQLAPGLTLPVDAVNQTIAILAKRRVGKSYTARRLAEQLFKAGQQIVIVDPKGDHWGIRSAADGKSPGLPIVILGGEHGDVPLEVGSGSIIAKLVAEERVSALLDLSYFRKHEVATFMTAFLEDLYRLKAREIYRTPLMLEVDEADAIAPQKPQPNEARMLGAMEDVVRRGGQRGIGCILITQRSAVLNKNVLTQSEMIIALRTIAPQDLAAIDAWVEVHGTEEQRETLMSSLPALPVGDAWFWAPGWPTADGIFKRVHVSPIETFDSGASPKAGEKRVEPKNLADVDLGALTKQMASTIEKAKENDPKLLKAEIARLKRELEAKPKTNGHTVVKEKLVVDQVAIDRAVARAIGTQRKKLLPALDRLQRLATPLLSLPDAIGAIAQILNEENVAIPGAPMPKFGRVNPSSPVASPSGTTPERRAGGHAGRDSRERPAPPAAGSGAVTKSMQKILDALAAFEQLGIAPAKRVNVAFFAGYTENGHFNNMVGDLRTNGFLDYPGGGTIQLTDAGRAIANAESSSIQSLDDLHRTWYGKLSPSEAKLLRVLVERYPDPIMREDLATRTGYTENGHFNNMVGHLRTLGAADYPGGGQVVATDVLFPEGLA